MRLAAAWLLGGLALMSCGAAAALDGPASADQVLERLSRALQEKNYRGLFTYEYGGTLDTLEIVHGVDEGIEYERLSHLNGPSREFIRRGRSADCVNTAARLLRGLRPASDDKARLADYYDFHLAGEDRVAGRPATVMHVEPRDQYRYGHTLYVDKASGLPLKFLVTNGRQQVLERIQFLELDVGMAFDQMALDPQSNTTMTVAPEASLCGNPAAELPPDSEPLPPAGENNLQWRARWLPTGFTLSEQSYSADLGYHLTYTDGLAAFSVFVLPRDQGDPAPTGVAQRGATVALVSLLQYQGRPVNITVIGEVPPATAENVARAMRPYSAGEDQP